APVPIDVAKLPLENAIFRNEAKFVEPALVAVSTIFHEWFACQKAFEPPGPFAPSRLKSRSNVDVPPRIKSPPTVMTPRSLPGLLVERAANCHWNSPRVERWALPLTETVPASTIVPPVATSSGL